MIDDPLAESLAKKDRGRDEFSGAVRVGVQQNPDEFAKALRLSAETGVMPEAVLRDMKAFDEAARTKRITELYDTHPKTAEWGGKNPSLFHDDLASITRLEPALAAVKPPETGFWETALGSFIQGSGRMGKGLTTDLSRLSEAINAPAMRAVSLLADTISGGDRVSRLVRSNALQNEAMRTSFDAAVFDPGKAMAEPMVNPERWFAQAVFGSAPDIIAGLATAGFGPTISVGSKAAPAAGAVKGLIQGVGRYLAARSPQIVAQTVTSLPSVLSSEIDQMQKNAPGMDRVEAAGQAAPSAVIQSILEGLVEVPLIERAQKAKGVVKRIAGLLASSGMEASEEVAQAITSQYLLPDPSGQRTLELKDIWENARGGFAAGLVFGGGAMITKPMMITPEETFFKALDDGAKESKLLKRMPEKYQELLAHLTKDGPVETVGIPVQQWETYWQSKDVDPVAKAMELGVDAEAYQNAVTLADDLTISTAAFGAKIAGTEDFAGLIPDVRYRQGMETARESERSADDEKAMVDEILARFQSAPEDGAAVEISTLKETLKQQLIDAGRPKKEADAQATLFERSIATLAVRNDMTPEDLLSRFTLKVNNGQVWAQPMSDVMGGTGEVASQAVEDFELDPWNTMYQSGQVQQVGLPVVDSTSYKGERQGSLMGPNDEQLVARDPETGEDIGRLWITRTDGGFEVRKVETDPAFQGRGVARKLYREANSRFGTYQGSTDQTPDGKAFVSRLRQTDPQIFGEAVLGSMIPQILYQSAKSITDTPEFKAWFGGSKAVDSRGKPIVLYHGTTNIFDTFDRSKANPESDMGAGFYFTNNRDDVSENYSGEGPDLTNKIERMAERIESERDIPMEDAMKIARDEFSKHEGATIPVFLKIEHPFEIDGEKGTFLDFDEGYDPETKEYTGDQSGKLADFIVALRDISSKFDGGDVDPVIEKIAEEGMDGGIKASDLWEILANDEHLNYFEDSEGNLSSKEIIRQALEQTGYDGVIDRTVNKKFGSERKIGKQMAGMKKGTVHYIVFESTQIKSAIGNRGTFDPSSPNILFQPMKRNPADYKRLRARLASLRSLSPTHQAGELTRRALEAKAIEAEFRAFDKAAMEIGDIEGKRAYLQIGPDHSFNLGLLKNANVSSASHEFGHFYLEILADLAGRENATQQVRDDYETIVKTYGTDGVIDRDGHERFADAHLIYLSEGRAPSVGLQGAFQRFSTWLAKVWTVIKTDMVDVQLTDEVRGVFDRLYATDAEIEAVKDSLGRPMFKTAEEMGRTKDQFAVYLRAEETRKAEAREAAMRVLMLELKRENSKEWADLYETVHARVKAEVEARPEYVALLALTAKDSETRMSKQALLDRGVDLKSLAQDGIKYVYSDKSKMDPDTAATLLGFETGDQLIQTLTGLESRVALAERLTMDEVHQTFPDTMEDPAALRELALKVLADSESASDRMALEAQVLRDKLNEGKAAAKAKLPDMKAYREAARQMIQGMNAYGLRPDRYLLARGKASNEAYRANAKGDYAKANEAKEREILNHFLYMESVKVRDDIDRFETFDKKFDTAKTREQIGKAGGTFLEQIDAMRLRFGLSLFPGESMGIRDETLAQWVAANEFAEIDDKVVDESWKKPVKDMTVAELNMVWDALKNIKALAYGETRFMVKGQQVSYELAGLEIEEAITKNNKRKPGHISGYKESVKEKTVNHLKGWDATLVKIEALVNWMDGGKVEGPAHRYLWQPLVDAQTARYDLTVKLALPLQEALREMPEAQRKSMDDTFTVDGFSEPLTRRQIISMLFNMGNDANRTKLIEGYGWSEYQVQQALSNLNAADAAFVQSTWDTIATLWPDMVTLEKRSTGVEPKKQEIAPYTLYGKNGEVIAEMDGGYWPIKYDPTESEFGEKQLAGDALRMATASRPGTSRSALKERTNAVGPLLLSFDYILQRHLTDVILDLTHREVLNSVHRLTKRPEVKKAIQEAFGDEYYQQFSPWLNTIAGDGSSAAAMGLDKWARAAMMMRSHTVAAVLGLKATTVIVQFADLTRVLGPGDYRVKGRYYFEAFSAFLGDPKGEIARVRELSGEMRHRPENLDRDIREVLKQMTGQQSLKDRYNRAAFKGIAFMDTWISVTAWSGAFKQAMAEHGDTERAIMEADRVVRLKLMSGNPKDLVAVQRSNELMKLLTMYMGDMTSNYNMMRNAGHKAKGLGGFVTQFTPSVLLVMAGAIIGDMLKGQGPDDDEDKVQWYLRKAAMAPFQTIPGLRDGARALDAKLASKPFSDYQFTPAFAAIQKAINAIDITVDMLGEEKDVEAFDWAVKAGEAIGYAFGIGGTAQAASTTKYLRRVNEGEAVEGAIVDITGSEGAQVAYNATMGKPKKGTR